MLEPRKYTPKIIDFIDFDMLPEPYRDLAQSLSCMDEYLIDYSDGDYYWPVNLNIDSQRKYGSADSLRLCEYLNENLPADVVATNKFGIYVYQ